jgi:hypothetical protein
MPRNSSGVYSKPAGTTATSGTAISSSAWNALTTDLGSELTASLPRAGTAPMTGQLIGKAGGPTSPSFTFSGDTQSGFYSAATSEIGITCNNIKSASFADLGILNLFSANPKLQFNDTTSGHYSGRQRVNNNNLYFEASTDGSTWNEAFRFELDTMKFVSSGANQYSGTATFSAYQKFVTSAGAGDPYGGRLLHLESFAPGIWFKDDNSSAYNGLINVNTSRMYIYGTNSGSGASLTEVWRLRLDTGDAQILGDFTNSGSGWTSQPDFTSGSSITGYYLAAAGSLSASKSGGFAAQLRRTTSTGDIQRFYQGNSLVGSISVSSTTTAYNVSSDQTLKIDDGALTFEQARAILDLIAFHNYRWKADNRAEHGVFAQELHTIYPNAVRVGGWVRQDDKDEEMACHEGDEGAWYVPWSVDYSRLVPVIGATLKGVLGRQDEILARLAVLESAQ